MTWVSLLCVLIATNICKYTSNDMYGTIKRIDIPINKVEHLHAFYNKQPIFDNNNVDELCKKINKLHTYSLGEPNPYDLEIFVVYEPPTRNSIRIIID
jgi:hypothetical protein